MKNNLINNEDLSDIINEKVTNKKQESKLANMNKTQKFVKTSKKQNAMVQTCSNLAKEIQGAIAETIHKEQEAAIKREA